MEQQLHQAAKTGNLGQVKRILRDHPETDVNWESDYFDLTALDWACIRGHASVVSTLLAHPTIHVNTKGRVGWTALWYAAYRGPVTCLRLLLEDPRVDVNSHTRCGETALIQATSCGRLDSVRWMIASGRNFDLGKRGRKDDAIASAKVESWESDDTKKAKDAIVSLLKRWKKDPAQTRFEVKVGLGFQEEMGAEVFGLAQFLCEGLVRLHRRGGKALEPGKRFFKIAKRLPIELQMKLCHVAMGSTKEYIADEASRAAFASVATKLEDTSGAPDYLDYKYAPKTIW